MGTKKPSKRRLGKKDMKRLKGGAVAPLAAIMMAPAATQVSTAVDLGTVSTTRTDVQNSSDRAELAGGPGSSRKD